VIVAVDTVDEVETDETKEIDDVWSVIPISHVTVSRTALIPTTTLDCDVSAVTLHVTPLTKLTVLVDTDDTTMAVAVAVTATAVAV
jgi:hypothetical protein